MSSPTDRGFGEQTMIASALTAIDDRRRSFAAWRAGRPFWGGVLLVLSGVAIGYLPFRLALQLAFVPGQLAFVGLLFAVPIVLCGLFALAIPDLSSVFGGCAIALAIVSIIGGTLGGFLVGSLLGVLGGAHCIAWYDP